MIKKCKQCGCHLTAAESNRICEKCRMKKRSKQEEAAAAAAASKRGDKAKKHQ